MKINIFITATPRTELHKVTLLPALEALNEHFDLKLFINLDNCLGREAYLESLEFLESLPCESLELITPDTEGSFKLAAKRVYLACTPEEDDLFFWLEDDWILTDPDKFVQAIKEFPESDHDFILTSIYDEVGGNPQVFKRQFFDRLLYLYQVDYQRDEDTIDPELIIRQAAKNIWGHRDKCKRKRLPKAFVDAGRDWRADRGIEKEFKHSKLLQTWHFKGDKNG